MNDLKFETARDKASSVTSIVIINGLILVLVMVTKTLYQANKKETLKSEEFEQKFGELVEGQKKSK